MFKRITAIGLALAAVLNYNVASAAEGSLKVPFDSTSEQIARYFKGHSPKEIAAALASKPMPVKGEFEKAEALNARYDAWMEAPLFGSVTPGSRLAFEVDTILTRSDEARLEYDADREVMTLTIPQNFCGGQAGIRLFKTVKNEGSYVASNAFNKKMKVTKFKSSSICLDVGLTLLDEKRIEFPVPLDQARIIKGYGKVLLIGRLGIPYVSTSEAIDRPTIDNPYDTYSKATLLKFNVEAVWVVDSTTGKVLYKGFY